MPVTCGGAPYPNSHARAYAKSVAPDPGSCSGELPELAGRAGVSFSRYAAGAGNEPGPAAVHSRNFRGPVMSPSKTITRSSDWMSRGECQREDPELFFPIAAIGPALHQVNAAKAVCLRCAVRAACLSYGLETRQEGIWGGTTWDERAAMSEPARSEPHRSDPARSEPGRSEPGRSEPGRSEPARSDAAREPAVICLGRPLQRGLYIGPVGVGMPGRDLREPAYPPVIRIELGGVQPGH
jgi:WhiB family redox-sensing transcriptional regulator